MASWAPMNGLVAQVAARQPQMPSVGVYRSINGLNGLIDRWIDGSDGLNQLICINRLIKNINQPINDINEPINGNQLSD